MRFAPLLLLIGFVLLFLAVLFGFDWWQTWKYSLKEEMCITLPDSMGGRKFFPARVRNDNVVSLQAQFPEISSEKKVSQLVAMLDSAPSVNCRGVGICGAYTWEYACYERLNQIATNEELVRLSRNRNPVIQVYAYMAALRRDSVTATKIGKLLENNSRTFDNFCGCTVIPETVKDYVKYNHY